VALLNKAIFYTLKGTALILNDMSTKNFPQAMLYINCKTCDNLTICINVNYSILSCLIINFLLCIVTNWKNFLTMQVHDGEKTICTDFGYLVYYFTQALANDI
jgi:hypothetical protein